MNMMIDIRKIRYLINVLGLTLEESLRIDLKLASEYGLIPAVAAGRPSTISGKRAELERREIEGAAS